MNCACTCDCSRCLPTRSDSMRTELDELLDRCAPDELESFLYMARRVDKARAVYGALDLDNDDRDWDAEIRAEHADALAYEMFRRVQQGRRR